MTHPKPRPSSEPKAGRIEDGILPEAVQGPQVAEESSRIPARAPSAEKRARDWIDLQISCQRENCGGVEECEECREDMASLTAEIREVEEAAFVRGLRANEPEWLKKVEAAERRGVEKGREAIESVARKVCSRAYRTRTTVGGEKPFHYVEVPEDVVFELASLLHDEEESRARSAKSSIPIPDAPPMTDAEPEVGEDAPRGGPARGKSAHDEQAKAKGETRK